MTIWNRFDTGLELKQSTGTPPTRLEPTVKDDAEEFAKRLAGVWTAAEERTDRVSDLDVNVFGSHAFDIRDVSLTIHGSGEAALRVALAVVDGKGRKQVPSVIEAKLRLGVPTATGTD